MFEISSSFKDTLVREARQYRSTKICSCRRTRENEIVTWLCKQGFVTLKLIKRLICPLQVEVNYILVTNVINHQRSIIGAYNNHVLKTNKPETHVKIMWFW